MEKLLKLEELAMFILGIIVFSQQPFSWWWFLVLILLPDLGMLGYLINSKVGALTYNICHHKGLALCLYFIGVYLEMPIWQLIGIIILSHASLDRIFGYGLKFEDAFNHTHLGKIGKN
ncbi:MAG: DUF4260 domain-containing protein [Algicola sp.]|nr:DUF4260 domain-containing protein [Algicola sp.]